VRRSRLTAADWKSSADWESNPESWYRSRPVTALHERPRQRGAGGAGRTPPARRGTYRGNYGVPPSQQRFPWFMIVALTVGLAIATYGLIRFGYGPTGNRHDADPPSSAVTSLQSHRVAGFPLRSHYIGMATTTPFQTTLPALVHNLGVKPGIVEYYMAFGHAFPMAQTEYLDRQKILPLIQINPKTTDLHHVAIGSYDSYLIKLADQVKKISAPVALSFAHEMNGWWYPWSVRDPTPQQVQLRPQFFRAAWRHIVRVFRREHVTNVTWVWTISRDAQRYGWPDLQAWWPGDKYVDWVGMNGYYRKPGDTFDYLYKAQLQTLRTFTNDPVLITETAVGPGPSLRPQVANLFAGVARTKGMLGFIWFNLNADEHWNVDSEPQAIQALHAGIARYGMLTH
jgi:hypothetical protein